MLNKVLFSKEVIDNCCLLYKKLIIDLTETIQVCFNWVSSIYNNPNLIGYFLVK